MAANDHSDVQRVISKCRDNGCLLLVFVCGKLNIRICATVHRVSLKSRAYVRMYVHRHTCKHATLTNTYAHTYRHTHTHIYIYTYIYTHTHTQHKHTHINYTILTHYR